MKKRVLAILLTLAMVAALLPVAALAVEPGETVGENAIIEIDSAEDLATAIKYQKNGQTWNLAARTYNLDETCLAQYAEVRPGSSGQGGWYFPITANNIKINGNGATVTSSVEKPNGAWAAQDFISVWGNNVTIDNLKIKSKKEANKAIEVLGQNFTITNSEILSVEDDVTFGGSIFFNPLNSGKNIGTAKIENVKISAYISSNTTYVKAGTLTIKDVTFTPTNAWEQWGTGYGPGISNNPSVVTATNIVYELDASGVNCWGDIFDESNPHIADTPAGTVVKLTEDVKLDKMLTITNSDITLDLGGHTITASDSFTHSYKNHNDAHLVQVGDNAKNVTITNGTLQATDKNKHVLNVYGSTGVILRDLTLDHTNAGYDGAPLVINASTVTAGGQMNFVTGTNSWYAVNVDPKENGKTATLSFEVNTKITHAEKGKEVDLIKVDNASYQNPSSGDILPNPENAGLEMSTNDADNPIFNLAETPTTPSTPTTPPVWVRPGGDLMITRLPDGVNNAPVLVTITLDRLLSGSYGGITFTGGVAEVLLAPGGMAYVSDLPAGTFYTVSVPDGTVLSSDNLSGIIPVDGAAQAGFTAIPGSDDFEIVEGEGDEEGDVQEGTEETPPEETVPEEGLEELPEEGETPAEEEPVDVPKTGDAAPTIGLALVLGLAACAVVLKKARAK